MALRPGPIPDYTWDSRLRGGSGGYRSEATGRIVARAEVTAQLERVMTASRDNMRAVTQRYLDGELTLPAFQTQMAQEIKTAHVVAAAAAKGGWDRMTPSDWGLVGQRVRSEYGYLRNYAREIASGQQPLNGSMLVRSGMYADAAHTTYAQIRARQAADAGLREQRRILHARESCNGCIGVAALGWQPLGSLPQIGSQECRSHCKCEDIFR